MGMRGLKQLIAYTLVCLVKEIRPVLKKLLAFTCLTLSMGAHAAQVIWTFDNVSYEDGGTTVGSFTYDTTSDSVISANWVTTCGGTLCQGDLTIESFTGDGDELLSNNVDDSGGPLEFWNDFYWDRNLSDGPGVVRIIDGWIHEPDSETEVWLMSGTISSVPLPAAAWLFGSALLGLGALKRKKA